MLRGEGELQRKRGELEAEERLIRPYIEEAERERERGRREGDAARRKLEEAEAKMLSVIEANNNVLSREKAAAEAVRRSDLEVKRTQTERLLLRSKAEAMRRAMQAVRAERDGLRRVAFELSRQMTLLHRAVAWLSRYDDGDGLSGISAVAELDDSDVGDNRLAIGYSREVLRGRAVGWTEQDKRALVQCLLQIEEATEGLRSAVAALTVTHGWREGVAGLDRLVEDEGEQGIPLDRMPLDGRQRLDGRELSTVVITPHERVRREDNDIPNQSALWSSYAFPTDDPAPVPSYPNHYPSQSTIPSFFRNPISAKTATIDFTSDLSFQDFNNNQHVLGVRSAMEEADRCLRGLKEKAFKYNSNS